MTLPTPEKERLSSSLGDLSLSLSPTTEAREEEEPDKLLAGSEKAAGHHEEVATEDTGEEQEPKDPQMREFCCLCRKLQKPLSKNAFENCDCFIYDDDDDDNI